MLLKIGSLTNTKKAGYLSYDTESYKTIVTDNHEKTASRVKKAVHQPFEFRVMPISQRINAAVQKHTQGSVRLQLNRARIALYARVQNRDQ